MNLSLKFFILLLSLIRLWSSGLSLIPIIGNYYPNERDALLQLKNSFASPNLNSNWTGPPCMNNQSRWGGIACANGHVVRLVLEGLELSGSLPPEFLQNLTLLTKLSFQNNSIFGPLPNLTNLVYLEYVFLSHNLFTSSIPFDYIQLPNLKKIELQQNYLQGEIPPFDQETLLDFNVSYNSLEGPIPQTNVLRGFPESCFQHNPGLCGSPLKIPCPVSPTPSISPPPPGSSKKSFRVRNLVLIVAVSVLIPLLVILVFFWYYKRAYRKETDKRKNAEWAIGLAEMKMRPTKRAEDPERTAELEVFDKNIPAFDLDDLLRASAEVLGKGKLSTTYKASLESGLVFTVKRFKNLNGLSNKEFIQHMQLLGKLKHQNLTQIISFYNSKKEKLIIYEFVPNGNLFELLHENRGSGRIPLTWPTRLSIIKDVAMAMNFLHQCLPSHKVPHANLKTSNVLIHHQGQNYHSKVTDFGYYPLLPSRKSLDKLAIGRSPEFCQGKKLTHKTDVYGFGIMLLEIITGRIPGDDENTTGENDDQDRPVGELSEWVRTVVNNDWSTDILDVEIVGAREAHNDMLKLTQLALECTDLVPEKRPKMSEVLRRIEEIQQSKSESD